MLVPGAATDMEIDEIRRREISCSAPQGPQPPPGHPRQAIAGVRHRRSGARAAEKLNDAPLEPGARLGSAKPRSCCCSWHGLPRRVRLACPPDSGCEHPVPRLIVGAAQDFNHAFECSVSWSNLVKATKKRLICEDIIK